MLTFLIDRIGILIDMDAYPANRYWERGFWMHLVAGMTFTNEWSFIDQRIGTNFPLWSLSYEVAYYVAFMLLLFFRGVGMVIALALVILVAGVKVWLLLPAWLIGVWLHHLLRLDRRSRGTSLLLMVLPMALYFLFLALGIRDLLGALSDLLVLRFIGHSVGFSNEFIWDITVACLFALHLLGAAGLLKTVGTASGPLSGCIRWLAGGTFSLYVVHFPVLMFTNAAMGMHLSGLSRIGVLLTLTVVACYVFAWCFERRLTRFRAGIRTFGALAGSWYRARHND